MSPTPPNTLLAFAEAIATADIVVVFVFVSGISSCIESPDLESPDLESPDLESPDLESPDLESPDLESPDLESPDLESPDLESPLLFVQSSSLHSLCLFFSLHS